MRHFFSAGLRLVISLGEAARKFEGRSRKSKNTDQVCHRVTHCYRLIRILFKISTTSSPRALQRIHSQLVARQDETFCQRLQSSEIRLIRQSVPDSHHQRSLHSLASPNLDGRFGKIAIHSSRATNSCRYLAISSSAYLEDRTFTIPSNSRFSSAVFTSWQVFKSFFGKAATANYILKYRPTFSKLLVPSTWQHLLWRLHSRCGPG
jgi:hypothetical protein